MLGVALASNKGGHDGLNPRLHIPNGITVIPKWLIPIHSTQPILKDLHDVEPSVGALLVEGIHDIPCKSAYGLMLIVHKHTLQGCLECNVHYSILLHRLVCETMVEAEWYIFMKPGIVYEDSLDDELMKWR